MLIGLTGPQQGGKDTIANGLCKLLSLDKRRFSEKLYAMAAVVDPAFHPEMPHCDKEGYVLDDPELGTRREFLEKLGTEFGREMISRNIWTKFLMASVKGKPTVICDVRFESEAKAIREAGGIIIHLRPDWTTYRQAHISDFQLPPADCDRIVKLTVGQVERGIEKAASTAIRAFEGLEG